MSDMILVHVSCADRAQAEAIAAALLDARLVACASIGPEVQSHYRWQGALETSGEVMLLLKTTAARFVEIEAAVRARHSYQVPEIIAVPVAFASAPYLAWLRQSVS